MCHQSDGFFKRNEATKYESWGLETVGTRKKITRIKNTDFLQSKGVPKHRGCKDSETRRSKCETF